MRNIDKLTENYKKAKLLKSQQTFYRNYYFPLHHSVSVFKKELIWEVMNLCAHFVHFIYSNSLSQIILLIRQYLKQILLGLTIANPTEFFITLS